MTKEKYNFPDDEPWWKFYPWAISVIIIGFILTIIISLWNKIRWDENKRLWLWVVVLIALNIILSVVGRTIDS